VLGGVMCCLTDVGFKNHLSDAVAVAQVNKNNSAQISPGINPAVQDNTLAYGRFSQLTAGVSSTLKKHTFPWKIAIRFCSGLRVQAGYGYNGLKTGSQFTDLGGEFEGKNQIRPGC